jgi:hypothetical protein
VADTAGDEANEGLARLRLGKVELLDDQRLAELLEHRGADLHGRQAIAPRLGCRHRELVLRLDRSPSVVYDGPVLGALRARAPERHGPFVGVVKTNEKYGIAVPKGYGILERVDRALHRSSPTAPSSGCSAGG